MAKLRNLPTDFQQRNDLIADICQHGVDPETCWADFGEYDSDWEIAAAALRAELPLSGGLRAYRASLRPFYWRTYDEGFNPDLVCERPTWS